MMIYQAGYSSYFRFLILLQDLEFVQFHPTGIYGAGCLITEGILKKKIIVGMLKII